MCVTPLNMMPPPGSLSFISCTLHRRGARLPAGVLGPLAAQDFQSTGAQPEEAVATAHSGGSSCQAVDGAGRTSVEREGALDLLTLTQPRHSTGNLSNLECSFISELFLVSDLSVRRHNS